jgi:hypothetical protein
VILGRWALVAAAATLPSPNPAPHERPGWTASRSTKPNWRRFNLLWVFQIGSKIAFANRTASRFYTVSVAR